MKIPKPTFGPATLVTAAFIGPGTVTTCTLAGANYGFTLLWAMLLSIVLTIFLQEMTVRLGLVGQTGLGKAIRQQLNNPLLKILGIFLVIAAILVGNAAYQGGNLAGATLGLNDLFGNTFFGLTNFWLYLCSAIAFVFLFTGSYKLIEKFMIALVILMSLAFVLTAILLQPNLGSVLGGLFVPRFESGSALTIIALIGTTVVPYNLFLHASAVRKTWSSKEQLSQARGDLFWSIFLGGLISLAIIICAGSTLFGEGKEVKNALDMASQLEPLLGTWSKYLLCFGLFAAGITSAITAPLAAAFAASGVLGWKEDLKSTKFRIVWILVLMVGTLVAGSNFSALQIIFFAQVANGLLLPLVVAFLLWTMNSKELLGEWVNKPWQNVIAFFLMLASLGLGFRGIAKAMGWM